MPFFDFDKFRSTPLNQAPFDHLVVSGFLTPAGLAGARRDFPAIHRPGLFPLEETTFGPAFAAMIAEIRGPEMTAVFSEKFGLDLARLPLMITLRGRCQSGDGRIHTDSENKIVTALLYLNEAWHADGGRLRLLRRPNDLEDSVAEVPPHGGTLVAFRRSTNSWHGHRPFEGERRYIMFNWMKNSRVAAREVARHRLSAKVKRLLPVS